MWHSRSLSAFGKNNDTADVVSGLCNSWYEVLVYLVRGFVYLAVGGLAGCSQGTTGLTAVLLAVPDQVLARPSKYGWQYFSQEHFFHS
jgi:hypothetical protein